MIGTKYKFRHYRPDGYGRPLLIWASDGPAPRSPVSRLLRRGSIYPRRGEEIVRGSALDRDLIGSQLWTPNSLTDEGEKDILDVYFDDVAVRTTLYFRLYDDPAPLETDTLTTLTGEVTGTGYDGVAVTRNTDWTDPTLDAGDMQTVSSTKSFNAGGTWTSADQLVLSTVQNGTAGLFLAWSDLSTTRTLQNGDQLDVTMTVKLA